MDEEVCKGITLFSIPKMVVKICLFLLIFAQIQYIFAFSIWHSGIFILSI